MSRVAKLTPITLSLMLMACGKADPVDDGAVNPRNVLIGEASATGLAAPASGGLGWSYRPQENSAVFGPPNSPAFSIQCQKPKEGEPQLIFVRFLPPTGSAQGTLSFTGNGKAASVPIAAVTNPDGVGGQWRAATPPNDSTRDISETFGGPGTVEISITGTAPLVVPPADEPRRVLAACLAG